MIELRTDLHRALDLVLKLRKETETTAEEERLFDLIRAVLCDRIADENTIEDWRKRNGRA